MWFVGFGHSQVLLHVLNIHSHKVYMVFVSVTITEHVSLWFQSWLQKLLITSAKCLSESETQYYRNCKCKTIFQYWTEAHIPKRHKKTHTINIKGKLKLIKFLPIALCFLSIQCLSCTYAEYFHNSTTSLLSIFLIYFFCESCDIVNVLAVNFYS